MSFYGVVEKAGRIRPVRPTRFQAQRNITQHDVFLILFNKNRFMSPSFINSEIKTPEYKVAF